VLEIVVALKLALEVVLALELAPEAVGALGVAFRMDAAPGFDKVIAVVTVIVLVCVTG
jgi:hypothetical protein